MNQSRWFRIPREPTDEDGPGYVPMPKYTDLMSGGFSHFLISNSSELVVNAVGDADEMVRLKEMGDVTELTESEALREYLDNGQSAVEPGKRLGHALKQSLAPSERMPEFSTVDGRVIDSTIDGNDAGRNPLDAIKRGVGNDR